MFCKTVHIFEATLLVCIVSIFCINNSRLSSSFILSRCDSPRGTHSLKMTERRLPLQDELPLKEADPEIYNIIQLESHRQQTSIELIASENFVSRACMEALGSILTNKYSEGYPGKRYYGACHYYDQIESLCMKRALQVFGLDPEEWGVNVQPLSGSPANLAVYTGLLQPHDKIMGLSLMAGGHLTHGFYTGQKKISASSIFFTSLSYTLDPETGLINYNEVERLAQLYCPKLIIAGASTYTRHIDYKRFREIADSVGAYLMADIAHIAGFVSVGLHPSPFEYCHVVTSTTHKTMKGPRAGIIFYNKKLTPDISEQINSAVFPTIQGGPHNNAIAAFAVQLNQMLKPEWKEYVTGILNNSRALSDELQKRGVSVATGGTDNHTVIVNLKPFGITGSKAELVCEKVNIAISKSTVVGDKSSLNPSGIRLGTQAMTARGAIPEDMAFIAECVLKVVGICTRLQEEFGKKLVDFKKGLDGDAEIAELRKTVEEWAARFPHVSLPL
ncbi:serine hydroxymethyltransferase, putative [Theileria equi strain WA]|uniref:Serine hydroxymethyltransferase n=1 Tax=Theileria equi strain WA TaxID=1537102 RepID=L0AXB2_THEEQ|nr:serine hydroxymethyltransferase, putative [Theileria equi strain WA]AFZ80205.1 serine hydroxymethyltransferase, putative [Theileria equi strain WA]|eukprot:XP_004829871.1 serine hydroxymethyltransferase, putative [Theileria equi strain WA]